MPVVFVNYRTQEQSGYAILLHRELATRFGADRIFLASSSIELGDDFVTEILSALGECAVLLAVIGRGWAHLFGTGEQDWVRLEIREALARGLRVIPVLVEDAEAPVEEDLPPDIAALARCQYVRLHHRSIDGDLAALVATLHNLVPELRPKPSSAAARTLYRPPNSACLIGVIPGGISQVGDVDIWVNSENTDLEMARPTEFSVSAIIRYWGAVRDETGRIVGDVIADELRAKTGGRGPVAAGTAVITGAGTLTATHNVRHIIHVATVQGEPGAGFRQVHNIEWCVTNVLDRAEQLAATDGDRSVLFPMLGTGMAHADPAPTARKMLTGTLDYLARHPNTRLRRIFILGYDERERSMLDSLLRDFPTISP